MGLLYFLLGVLTGISPFAVWGVRHAMWARSNLKFCNEQDAKRAAEKAHPDPLDREIVRLIQAQKEQDRKPAPSFLGFTSRV